MIGCDGVIPSGCSTASAEATTRSDACGLLIGKLESVPTVRVCWFTSSCYNDNHSLLN
jgi:hypothetical protein